MGLERGLGERAWREGLDRGLAFFLGRDDGLCSWLPRGEHSLGHGKRGLIMGWRRRFLNWSILGLDAMRNNNHVGLDSVGLDSISLERFGLNNVNLGLRSQGRHGDGVLVLALCDVGHKIGKHVGAVQRCHRLSDVGLVCRRVREQPLLSLGVGISERQGGFDLGRCPELGARLVPERGQRRVLGLGLAGRGAEG